MYILILLTARQNNEQQKPRPFESTKHQAEFRGYLPPQPVPQPEFPLPVTSQFPSTPDSNSFSNPLPQTTAPDQEPQQPVSTSTPDVSSDAPQQTTVFTDEPTSFLVTNPPFDPSAENLQENLEDVIHPPHIHQINVQCSKDMMTINVEFNKQYDGVIYSKVLYPIKYRYIYINYNKYVFGI